MCLDPGIRGTGVTLWSSDDWDVLAGPIVCYNIYPKKKLVFPEEYYYPDCWSHLPDTRDKWIHRAQIVNCRIRILIERFMPTHVYCEFPAFFQSSGGQKTAKSGALVKLVFTVGATAETCRTLGIQFIPVPVNQWKGQLPKEVVEERVMKRLKGVPFAPFDDHCIDSVGIGLYVKGFLK